MPLRAPLALPLRTSALAAVAALLGGVKTAHAVVAPLVVPTDDDYQDCGDWCAVSIIFIILFGSVLICCCVMGSFFLANRGKQKAAAGGNVGHRRGFRSRSRSPMALNAARTPVMRSASPAPLMVPQMMAPQQMMSMGPQFVSVGPPAGFMTEQLYDAFGQPVMRG